MPNGNNSEVAVSVSGDFDTFLNLGDDFSLPDLDWGAAAPAPNGGAISFSLGGFTFTGTFISEFQNANFINILATGFFTGNSFDPTYGEATIGFTKVSGTEVSYSGTVTAFNDDEAPPENPTPEGGTTVALLGVAFRFNAVDDHLWFGSYQPGPALLHPLALVYVVSGSAMISATLRVPKP
jgi:hypothetical protein